MIVKNFISIAAFIMLLLSASCDKGRNSYVNRYKDVQFKQEKDSIEFASKYRLSGIDYGRDCSLPGPPYRYTYTMTSSEWYEIIRPGGEQVMHAPDTINLKDKWIDAYLYDGTNIKIVAQENLTGKPREYVLCLDDSHSTLTVNIKQDGK